MLGAGGRTGVKRIAALNAGVRRPLRAAGVPALSLRG